MGAFLSIAGFYVSNASSFPVVQRLMAPSYVAAKKAIARIQQEGSIRAGQPGFSALAEIVENKVAEKNKHVPRSVIVLEKLEAEGGGIRFGVTTSRPFVRLKMIFRNQQQPVQGDLLDLAEAVEESWKSRSLSWAAWVFWIGIVQTVWPLLIETKGRRVVRPDGVDDA
ncbi:MAG: hypothetical protein HYX97_01100 [Chloroflexi bacterium]|nr:hypothetical protein [Chloroflexota bacterium]